MSVIYITNNAATGTGSLYEAIKNAQEGDLITPDPAVFPPGSVVDITIANYLPFTVPVTIDAGATRIVLKRANSLIVNNSSTTNRIIGFKAIGVTFNGYIYLEGDGSDNKIACSFSKCVFSCNYAEHTPLQCIAYCDVVAEDCAFIGNLVRCIYARKGTTKIDLNRCTAAANKQNIQAYGTFTDCIIDPDLTASPFRNVPTSLDAYSQANPIPYDEWDFTPLPSSPFATGGTTSEGETDILGNKRGWTDANGATQYAVGAFEVVKADYFLSKGTPSSVRFTEPSTWKTTRGGNAAPEVVGAGVFYVDESKTFTDAPPEGASVVVAGPSCVEIGDACVLDEIRVGARSTVAFKGAVRASSFDLRDESLVEIRPEDVVVLDSLTYGAGVSLKSTGRAYLSAPGVDASAFNAEKVVIGQRGANLSGFYADRKSSNALVFTWTPKSSSASIVIEQRVGDSWTTAATAAGLKTTVDGFDESFSLNYDNWRAWDGDAFFFSAPPWSKTDFFRYWNGVETTVSVSEWAITPLVASEWTTTTYTARANDMGYRNENALFLALIKNPLTGKLLSPDDVESITATLYKVGGWATPNEWAAVEAWTSVSVPLDSVLYTPIAPSTLTGADLTWTKEEGPNFSWAPTTTDNVLFSENGSYVMQVKFVLKDGKNPIVATFSAKVS